MKKLLLSLVLIGLLVSCKKQKVSGCGVCIGSGDIDCSSGTCTYWLPIRFDDGHTQNVYVDEYTWVHTNMDERICF